jgi:hypothetical protein
MEAPSLATHHNPPLPPIKAPLPHNNNPLSPWERGVVRGWQGEGCT